MHAWARWQLNERIGRTGGACGSVESTYLFMGGSHHLALMNSCHTKLELGPELPDLLTFQEKNQMSDLFVKYLTLRYWPSLKKTNRQKLTLMWAKQSTFVGDTCPNCHFQPVNYPICLDCSRVQSWRILPITSVCAMETKGDSLRNSSQPNGMGLEFHPFVNYCGGIS